MKYPNLFYSGGDSYSESHRSKGSACIEVVYDSLLNRLRRQPLDKGTEAIVEQLKKEYQYIPNMESLEEVLQKGGTERALFTINGQAYTGEMFKRFASSHPQAVKRQLNGFIAKISAGL